MGFLSKINFNTCQKCKKVVDKKNNSLIFTCTAALRLNWFSFIPIKKFIFKEKFGD